MKWPAGSDRRWVVVAFWGIETTVKFFGDEEGAVAEYENSVSQGADVFYARAKRCFRQGSNP